jgi:hypothetical protein
MKQERIEYFENLLQKPMAEPHRGYIEELLQAVKDKGKPNGIARAIGAKLKQTMPAIDMLEAQGALPHITPDHATGLE